MAKRSWPPSGAKVRELELKATKYDELMTKQMLRPFCQEFIEALGTLAATNPYNSWPAWFQEAFKHAAQQYPDESRMYKERLPK
jgi:hypothetical protein